MTIVAAAPPKPSPKYSKNKALVFLFVLLSFYLLASIRFARLSTAFSSFQFSGSIPALILNSFEFLILLQSRIFSCLGYLCLSVIKLLVISLLAFSFLFFCFFLVRFVFDKIRADRFGFRFSKRLNDVSRTTKAAQAKANRTVWGRGGASGTGGRIGALRAEMRSHAASVSDSVKNDEI